MSDRLQRRVIYTGRVQGVGFRATVSGIAARHPVSGYVRNRADGTVELVASGPAADVKRFLQAVSDRMSRYIESEEQQPAETAPQSGPFEIRY